MSRIFTKPGGEGQGGGGTPTTLVMPAEFTVTPVGAIITVDWNGRVLNDSLGFNAIDFDTRVMLTGGVVVMDWGLQNLIDSIGTVSVDWNQRLLIDNANITSIDWINRILRRSDNVVVFNWETLVFSTNLGGFYTVLADIANTILYDPNSGGSPIATLDWVARGLIDGNGAIYSLQWSARTTRSVNNNINFDWNADQKPSPTGPINTALAAADILGNPTLVVNIINNLRTRLNEAVACLQQYKQIGP